MQAVARREVQQRMVRRRAGGEGSDSGPVGFFGAIDDDVGYAGGGECGQNRRKVRAEGRGAEMVMSVAEVHHVVSTAWGSSEVQVGEGADTLAYGGETVATRGGEVGEEFEGGEWVGVTGGNFSGCSAAKKIGEADD